jgi:hypothetical protein
VDPSAPLSLKFTRTAGIGLLEIMLIREKLMEVTVREALTPAHQLRQAVDDRHDSHKHLVRYL